MGLFSFLRKNKQESAAGEDEFYASKAEEESTAIRGRGKRKQGKQADEPVDPVLPEKKRARRRLVGAVALVLAVIIGLPMVLDSEPKRLADDIAIQIPSKDKPFPSTGTHMPAASVPKLPMDGGLDKKEEVVELPTAPAAPVAKAGTDQAKIATPSVAVTPQTKSDTKAPVVVASATEKVHANAQPVEKASPKPDSKQEVKPAVTPKSVEKASDDARAKAILEGGAIATSDRAGPEKKTGKIIVQVAALASKEKVSELQQKLNDAGIQTYTQKVATESGERIRVRIGPLATKEEADKMRARLVKLGLNGTLVPTNP